MNTDSWGPEKENHLHGRLEQVLSSKKTDDVNQSTLHQDSFHRWKFKIIHFSKIILDRGPLLCLPNVKISKPPFACTSDWYILFLYWEILYFYQVNQEQICFYLIKLMRESLNVICSFSVCFLFVFALLCFCLVKLLFNFDILTQIVGTENLKGMALYRLVGVHYHSVLKISGRTWRRKASTDLLIIYIMAFNR